jgi:uncharacterized protein (DUF362 family)
MKTTSSSRRDFLRQAALTAAGACLFPASKSWARPAPTAPVAIGQCATYGPEVIPTLDQMFDQLGGLDRIVRGKTVAIKLNLTGLAVNRLGHHPAEATYWSHPQVIGAVVHLMGKAGARRIRLLESPMSTAESLEEFMLAGNWEPRDFINAAPRVELENTNGLGSGKKYTRFHVPGGGLVYPAYDLNHSYEDCDVFVSLAKLKEHYSAGITLSMKNCFGITPCTIYGDSAPVDEPSLVPKGGRGPFHWGNRQPARSALPELDPTTPRTDGWRVPRIVAEICAARPIHLAILDGIATQAGGEGPWVPGVRPVKAGVLVAGTNCVTTDAVGAALMGFDPMAERGTPPFETCDSTLQFGELLGLGTRDLKRIEVLGVPIEKAKVDFRRA